MKPLIPLLLATAALALAQKPLTVEDTLAGRAIGEVKLSPDGARVVFGLGSIDPTS